jgi:hypothetical protein
MLQIMLACARTSQFVPTGIETDMDTFIALPEVLCLTRCPACGGNHYWTKAETWICSAGYSSPSLLPAEIVCSRIVYRSQGPRNRLATLSQQPPAASHPGTVEDSLKRA